MLDTLQVADFDLDLAEILLVHKNTFVHRFKWTDYRAGRMIDGLAHCVSGRGFFDFGDTSFELSAGQVVFLPASSSYVVRGESEEPFIHYTANFRLGSAQPPELTAPREILAGRLRHITAASSAELYSERFERLLSVWQAKRNGYRVMSKAILYELLYLYFTDAGHSHRNTSEYEKILPARRLLDKHYSENQSISELAELCELSETHFRRLFARIYGMSPSEYRLNKRILRAKDLLLSGQYSISQTAHEVGFSDANYFTRVFKTRTGQAPTEFLRN